MRDPLTEREIEILERMSSGLSDQQIADALYLSLNTVKWYNRQIYSKLGVSSRMQASARAKNFGILGNRIAPPLPLPRHNLPIQTTPFIGRSQEIAEVVRLLRLYRLLTLTGTGGTGKTRLALEVVAAITDSFADGVYFVDLAPLSDPDLVAKAIAASLGVLENPGESLLDILKRVIAQRELLLLIDNFEHVIQAAPLVSDLLAASPRLKILVTSRESLRLSGEQEYPVQPLSLPITGTASVQSLAESEAGSLFVQRAQMALPHFEVRVDNAPAVAQICTRLDGLPLAIELAAARCKLLTPKALLERLEGAKDDSPLKALTGGSRDGPPRHRTLRDTIAWSYNLLDEGEKMLFARLAVFRGGRSLEAIEAVCGADLPIDVFDGLASLVDKSLVWQKESPSGEPRFTLLEMIHEYARERLEASGEAQTMRRRHALYFVELAERAEPELRLAGFDYWCQRFELDLDNMRAALEWSLGDGDVTLGVRLNNALRLFWYGKGSHIEGMRWTLPLLERLDEIPVIDHSAALISAGHMTFLRDLDAARLLFERALEISRELGSRIQIAWSTIFLGYTMQREPEAATAMTEAGLALFRELNHLPGIAQALNIIGEIARTNGDDEKAVQAYEQCLAVCQQTGEGRRICYMYFGLSHIAQHAGNHERALDFGLRGLRLARDRSDRSELVNGLAVLAGAFNLRGQSQRAARLLAASDVAAERMGIFHHPSDRPEIDRIIAAVRAQLDDATFQAAWDEGRKWSLAQAVADALDEA